MSACKPYFSGNAFSVISAFTCHPEKAVAGWFICGLPIDLILGFRMSPPRQKNDNGKFFSAAEEKFSIKKPLPLYEFTFLGSLPSRLIRKKRRVKVKQMRVKLILAFAGLFLIVSGFVIDSANNSIINFENKIVDKPFAMEKKKVYLQCYFFN